MLPTPSPRRTVKTIPAHTLQDWAECAAPRTFGLAVRMVGPVFRGAGRNITVLSGQTKMMPRQLQPALVGDVHLAAGGEVARLVPSGGDPRGGGTPTELGDGEVRVVAIAGRPLD